MLYIRTTLLTLTTIETLHTIVVQDPSTNILKCVLIFYDKSLLQFSVRGDHAILSAVILLSNFKIFFSGFYISSKFPTQQ